MKIVLQEIVKNVVKFRLARVAERQLKERDGICSQESMGRAHTQSKELVSMNVENSSDHRTEQLKIKLSHLGQTVNMKIESLL